MRTIEGDSSTFLVGLHWGWMLSPYLFVLVMNGLIICVQYEVPGCMLVAEVIVLIDDTRMG